MKKVSERLGEEKLNKDGYLMRIIEYIDNNNIIIEFVGTENRVNTTYKDFCTGNVDNKEGKKFIVSKHTPKIRDDMRVAKIQGIYKITNMVNGKIYIGSSYDIPSRWSNHIKELLKGKHHSQRLQEDFIKNNEEISTLRFQILEINNLLTKNELLDLEATYIKRYDSTNELVGYNGTAMRRRLVESEQAITINEEVERDNKIMDYVDTVNEETKEKLRKNLQLYSFNNFNKTAQKLTTDRYLCSANWFKKNKENFNIIKRHLHNFFSNMAKTRSKDNIWTTYVQYVDELKSRGYTKGYIPLNKLQGQKSIKACSFVANIFPQSVDTVYTPKEQDKYALSFLLKWIIGNININNEVALFLPSYRMYTLLKEYLEG